MTRPHSFPRQNAPDRPAPDHWALTTLPEVVQWRARHTPADLAYTFLVDGEDQTAEFTYEQLNRRAQAVAAELQQRAAPGERALVVLEPGLDYIAALFGCFYAGIVPAPVYPPDPFRIARTLPRLQAVFGSAACELLISTDEILGGPGGALRTTCPQGAVAIETIPDAAADAWRGAPADPAGLALLQYTSGTTGDPRGVPITHENLLNNLRTMERTLDVDDAVGMQWLPPYHDLGLIGGVFLPVFAGRHMVLMSPLSFMQSPVRWLRAISRYGATSSAAPNFGYELCVRKIREADCEGLDLSRWSVAVSGAEPVRAETLDRFSERFAPYGFRRAAFMPAYGMAETTLMVSVPPIGAPPTEIHLDADALSESRVERRPLGRRVVGCGHAAPGVELRIVDPEQGHETDGVGEVWVRGSSVASGYWRQDDQTAEHFGQSVNGYGAGFLRTGDLGFLDRGELFLVGRRKEVLILAGRNFYPQDIELALQSADPAFKGDGGAAVTVEVDQSERLVLFQEVLRPKKQDLDELLATARRVAIEEIGQEPWRVVLIPVGDLPKTSSGKTRRAECWQLYEAGALSVLAEWPTADAPTEAPTAEPPSTPTEQWLAGCWRDLLDLDEVSRRDNFFALGGRSLQVTELLSRVAEEHGLTLPLKSLLDFPTLAELAAAIDGQPADATTAAAADERSASVDLAQPQPLSPSQQRFWMVEKLGVPGGANVPVALRLDHQLDLERLRQSLGTLVGRHESLQCGFGEQAGVVTQRASASWQAPGVVEWSMPAGIADEDLLNRVLDEPWVWRPFDLGTPPLMRAALVDGGGGRQVLLLVFHHLVGDGASVDVLLDDLATIYAGGKPADRRSIADCLSRAESAAEQTADTSYWKTRLADAPGTIELPLDQRAGVGAEPAIVATRRALEDDLDAAVDCLARRLGTTPFVVYLSAFQVVLARYSGQSRIGVGVAVAGRDAAVGDAVGCFINTAPLFAEVNESSSDDFLKARHAEVLADLDHARLPWEAIVAAADKPRVPGRMPLVQTFFVHDEHRAAGDALGVVEAATDYRGLGVFDLSLVVETQGPRPRASLIHAANRFPTPIAERLLESYVATVRAFAESPLASLADSPVPSAKEAAQLQLGGEPTSLPAGPSVDSVDAWFAAQSKASPHSLAVECGDQSQSFAEVDALSERIARRLAAQGVGVGDRVGLLVRRGLELPALILGVWRAGAAYVPLDPDYPPARLKMMADDADLACLVLDEPAQDDWNAKGRPLVDHASLVSHEAELHEADAPTDLTGDRLAYVMYTSGSTGAPKGVMVPHHAVANLLRSFAHDTGLEAGHTMFASTTFAFDISVLELFLPLVTGATLVVAGSQTAGDPDRMTRLLRSRLVTHLQGAPSTFRMLLSAGWRPESRQTLLCGGEELTPDLAERLLESAGAVWNVYGPTETTIWSTRQVLETASAPIAIGRPIAATRCYVLDDQDRLAPVGVWGQLAIAGAGVADGYWNRPELTAERFPPDPHSPSPGGRRYLTGDAARWNADGELEFAGRSDGQVKVRGHRVELREIEMVLNAHGAVGESAVVARQTDGDSAALVAFVAPANGQPWTPAELREHVAGRLPGYMTPSAFVELESMPRTSNGKIDRKQLPVDRAEAARSTPIVPPRTPLEAQLAEWVKELLRIEQVGVYDNFFEIGGQSLLATQLLVRIREELGIEPPLRQIYERPTIAEWADLILRFEIESGDCVPADVLDQLDQMSDAEAAAFLQSLSES